MAHTIAPIKSQDQTWPCCLHPSGAPMHPPPPVLPFWLMQNLSPKDTAGYDIHEAESLMMHLCIIGW